MQPASTYTVAAEDEGKAIKVRVTFTDDAGNAESLTSYAALASQSQIFLDEDVSNAPATGAPGMDGSPLPGQTLTANTSGIQDEEGMTGAVFAYQWLADDAPAANATASTYAVAAADVGKALKVRVTFTDDAGNSESLTSAATAAVSQSLTVPLSPPTPLRPGARHRRFAGSRADLDRHHLRYRGRRRNHQRGLRLPMAGQRCSNPGRDGLNLRRGRSGRGQSPQGEGHVHRRRGQLENQLTSAATAAATQSLTAGTHDAPESHDGQSVFTFELRFRRHGRTSATAGPRLHRDRRTGYRGAAAGAEQERQVGASVRPSGATDATVSLPVAPPTAPAKEPSARTTVGCCPALSSLSFQGLPPAVFPRELSSDGRSGHHRNRPSGRDTGDRCHNGHSRRRRSHQRGLPSTIGWPTCRNR